MEKYIKFILFQHLDHTWIQTCSSLSKLYMKTSSMIILFLSISTFKVIYESTKIIKILIYGLSNFNFGQFLDYNLYPNHAISIKFWQVEHFQTFIPNFLKAFVPTWYLLQVKFYCINYDSNIVSYFKSWPQMYWFSGNKVQNWSQTRRPPWIEINVN